jgi:hypothetical protein
MGGYELFIFSLFHALQFLIVSAVLFCRFVCSHTSVSYVQSCRFISSLMPAVARFMFCINVSSIQFCCFACCLLFVSDIPCLMFRIVMIYELLSHVHDRYMLYVLACILTMNLVNIINSVYYASYVIIILLNYGIKMTWKLPNSLTGDTTQLIKSTCVGSIHYQCPRMLPSQAPIHVNHVYLYTCSNLDCVEVD